MQIKRDFFIIYDLCRVFGCALPHSSAISLNLLNVEVYTSCSYINLIKRFKNKQNKNAHQPKYTADVQQDI